MQQQREETLRENGGQANVEQDEGVWEDEEEEPPKKRTTTDGHLPSTSSRMLKAAFRGREV